MTAKEIDIFLELLKCARKKEIDQESLEKISGGWNSDYANGFLAGSVVTGSLTTLAVNIYYIYTLLKARNKSKKN